MYKTEILAQISHVSLASHYAVCELKHILDLMKGIVKLGSGFDSFEITPIIVLELFSHY